jgi:2-phospho-L-lactate guanylyltransferase
VRVIAVPVKPLARAKTRLGTVLTPEERARLTLAMLEDVLEAALAQLGWEVWVVSPSPAALEAGGRWGARLVPEHTGSLRGAVRQVEALVGASRGGPDAALAVLLADLPFVTAGALGLALATPGAVVAAPASDGGTNLLLRRPPSVVPARFGRASFARHRWEAARAGVPFRAVRLPELGFDLDRPHELAAVLGADRTSRTRAACLAMGLAERLGVRA